MGHSIDIREEAGIRYLHFGTDWVQGAMRLSKPNRLVLVYTQAMLSFLLFRPEPRNVLMIGLGAASLVRFFRHAMPDTHLTVIEINRDVIQVAHQFFRLPQDDDRLDVQVGDGFHYVQRTKLAFDAIFVDGYDHRARPASSSRSSSIAPAASGSRRKACWLPIRSAACADTGRPSATCATCSATASCCFRRWTRRTCW